LTDVSEVLTASISEQAASEKVSEDGETDLINTSETSVTSFQTNNA
jgi:hypothetical protein